MATFAERLKELRNLADLTQAGLAAKCNLPVFSLRNYEQGVREPSWAVMFRLAAALGVSCDAFKDCEGALPDEPERRGRGHAAKSKQPNGVKSNRRRK